MSQRMCRECHRLVSETAPTCPHCGIPHPAAVERGLSRMRPYGTALLLGVLLVWVGGMWFRYQVGQLEQAPPLPVPIAPREAHPAFQPLSQHIWVGAPLFGRTTWAYVGRVTSLTCPRQPAGPGGTGCLQIEFADGRRAWVQGSVAESQYVTPRR
jgi:hypothetical protein